MNKVGGGSIRNDGRSFEGLAKVDGMGKGPRHKLLGQTGECDKSSVPIGVNTNSTAMDGDGFNS